MSLPPWPPATSSTMCAVKVWVSRDVCPPAGTPSAHTHMRDDCNPTSTPPIAPPSERDPMHAGEGDGPSFDVMPRVVYLPREGKVLDFCVLMLLYTATYVSSYWSSYCAVCVLCRCSICSGTS